jgi:Ca2+:H+ antiporter
LSHWPWWIPIAALLLTVVVAAFALPLNAALVTACAVALIGAVIASVHHAEVVAHRIGEPLGTVVLSICVTVIEVALIFTVMLSGGPEAATLPRDTIYSVIMITCCGVVGLSLVIGAVRHREQAFHVLGSNASLATLVAMTTLALVLPTFTTSSAGPTYTTSQLMFASVASLALWCGFVFVQTVSHREYFVPVGIAPDTPAAALRPARGQALASFATLVVALLAVVGLAHEVSPSVEAVVVRTELPKSVLSVVIALLTLLPEAWAAIRAALADRIQTSLNLSLGSALASIGLTIPVIAISSKLVGITLVLGLAPKELVLVILAFFVTSITLVAGRTHLMLGLVHLVLFGAFLFLSVVP